MVTLEIGAFPLLRGCCPCSLRGAVICLVMVPVLVSQGSTSDLTELLGRGRGRGNTDYCPAWTTWPYAGALSQGYAGSPALGLDLHSGLYRARGATEVRAQGLPEVPSERARCLHRPPQALVLTRDRPPPLPPAPTLSGLSATCLTHCPVAGSRLHIFQQTLQPPRKPF